MYFFLLQHGGRGSSSSGKGRSPQGPIKYGFSLVKGKANHPMEDYHVAKFHHTKGHELGLFAIYDGHMGDSVPAYLQKHLFSNILKEVGCWIRKVGIFAILFISCIYLEIVSLTHSNVIILGEFLDWSSWFHFKSLREDWPGNSFS